MWKGSGAGEWIAGYSVEREGSWRVEQDRLETNKTRQLCRTTRPTRLLWLLHHDVFIHEFLFYPVSPSPSWMIEQHDAVHS